MIQFIFTIDYEIYGNGAGSLKDLVLEPAQRLVDVFQEWNASFVVFAEAVEFRKMEEFHSDEAIPEVRSQLRELRDRGCEIALHLHPWWANARHEHGQWSLDWSERNICTLAPERVETIVAEAIDYLRQALDDPDFTPVSFRGGLWAMQPTKTMARVLARHGVQVDSSVFKGGHIRGLGLDYRPSLKNGNTWRFSDEVNAPDSHGLLAEYPIHTEMVPFWKMLGSKRLSLQKKVPGASGGTPLPNRWLDFARLTYPRKLDFCRMSYDDMHDVMARVIREDKVTPHEAKTIVAIGHSKDLVDFDAISRFLSYLKQQKVAVTTFRQILPTPCVASQAC